MIAKDIMSTSVITVREDMPIKELADLFVKKKIGGAPVVNSQGDLVGIVTEGDLVSQDAKIHFPTYISLLSGFIYLPGSIARYESDLKKHLAQSVKDVMTSDVVTVSEDTSLEDIATLMIDKDVSHIPVLDQDGKLAGILTKHDIVRALSKP